jgi:hypothetical protein
MCELKFIFLSQIIKEFALSLLLVTSLKDGTFSVDERDEPGG